MPLSRALTILTREASNPAAQAKWKEVHGLVVDGVSLADAMAQSPETFPRVYVAMVQAARYLAAVTVDLLTQPDIPWVPDPGQRDSPEARARLHWLFEAEIERRRLPHVRLAGTIEQRMQLATAAIDRLFTAPTTQTAR